MRKAPILNFILISSIILLIFIPINHLGSIPLYTFTNNYDGFTLLNKIYVTGRITSINVENASEVFYNPYFIDLHLFEGLEMMLVSIILLLCFAFSFITIDPQLIQRMSNLKIFRRPLWIKKFLIGFRSLFTLASVLGIIGSSIVHRYSIIIRGYYQDAQVTTGFALMFTSFCIMVVLGILGIWKISKLKLLPNNKKQLERIAEIVVHDELMFDFEQHYLEEFIQEITESDIPVLFNMIVLEKFTAGDYTNDFDIMAKIFTKIHPQKIAFYEELATKYLNKEKQFIAEDLAEAIDLVM